MVVLGSRSKFWSTMLPGDDVLPIRYVLQDTSKTWFCHDPYRLSPRERKAIFETREGCWPSSYPQLSEKHMFPTRQNALILCKHSWRYPQQIHRAHLLITEIPLGAAEILRVAPPGRYIYRVDGFLNIDIRHSRPAPSRPTTVRSDESSADDVNGL